MPDKQERIRMRAHAFWEEEGRPDGHDKDHWDRAEAQIDREDAASFQDRRVATGRAAGISGVQPGGTTPVSRDPAKSVK